MIIPKAEQEFRKAEVSQLPRHLFYYPLKNGLTTAPLFKERKSSCNEQGCVLSFTILGIFHNTHRSIIDAVELLSLIFENYSCHFLLLIKKQSVRLLPHFASFYVVIIRVSLITVIHFLLFHLSLTRIFSMTRKQIQYQ